MAAGGSDPRSGDVEEDASQLIFPKGAPWAGVAKGAEEEGEGRWARYRGNWPAGVHTGSPGAVGAQLYIAPGGLLFVLKSQGSEKLREAGVGPFEAHLDLLAGGYGVRRLPFHTLRSGLWDESPIFRCCLEQTNYFDSLQFS